MRAVWEEQTSKWWFCAADIAEALTKSKRPRTYWNAIKRRNPQLSTICRQLKLTAKDGKRYLTDVVDEEGVNTVIAVIPSKKSLVFDKWLKGMGTSIDEKSKQKAYELFESYVFKICQQLKTINLNVFEAGQYDSIMTKLKEYGAKCDIKKWIVE